MKTILLILIFALIGCGKNKTGKPCKSRYHKVMECMQGLPYHHPTYAQRVCENKHWQERCYK